MCTNGTQKTICVLCLISYWSAFSQIDSLPIQTIDSSTAVFNLAGLNGFETDETLEDQELNPLLTSSPDVYVQFATFQFGAARYKTRGAAAKNQLVMMNGIDMANPENGLASWGNWGGLNDITRFTDNQMGNAVFAYGFSGPLGYVHIDAKASGYRKGTRFSYSNSNRQFKNRLMITHSTGNLSNGWAFTASASHRSGNLYIPGTFIQASSFYMSADKRINTKHLLSLSGLFAPTERAGSGTEQQETYELTGSNYYNARWGYQNGKARNASIRKSARPVLFISHTYQPKHGTQWNTSVAYVSGKNSISGLNWNQAPNPNPDYYRYLPSYCYANGDTLEGNLITEKWRNDRDTRQIHWDQLIAMNRANLYSIPSANAPVNTIETRARYILENRTEALNQVSFNSTYLKRFRKIFSSSGVNGTYYANRKYKEVEDLLGASYWLDYDQFAQGLGIDPAIQQNNLDAPDKKIYKGDRFGYDYTIHIRKAELWTQLEYKLKKLDVYAGWSLSTSNVWRESFMANGKFPNASKGESVKVTFINYGLKGGATYKLSGRQFLTFHATLFTKPPVTNNLFIAPDVRNDLVNEIKNEKNLSSDLNYIIKAPGFKFRLSAYYTRVKDLSWLKTYWSDLSNTFIHYIMTGVNQQQTGVELGLEKTIFVVHTFQAALGWGNFIYTNRPLAQAWQSNNNTALFNQRRVYLKNLHLGGSPQVAMGIAYRYLSSNRLFAGINLNYFDQIFAEINPDKRTVEALGTYSLDDVSRVKKIIEQEQLPSYFILNGSIGKSLKIYKKYTLNIQLSINNLLNNKTIAIFTTEQLRWDVQYPDRFPNKYTYMPGLTYMALINMNF